MQFKKEGLHLISTGLQVIGGQLLQTNATSFAEYNLSSVAFVCGNGVALIPSFLNCINPENVISNPCANQ